jgi:hypothetical protein
MRRIFKPKEPELSYQTHEELPGILSLFWRGRSGAAECRELAASEGVSEGWFSRADKGLKSFLFRADIR